MINRVLLLGGGEGKVGRGDEAVDVVVGVVAKESRQEMREESYVEYQCQSFQFLFQGTRMRQEECCEEEMLKMCEFLCQVLGQIFF